MWWMLVAWAGEATSLERLEALQVEAPARISAALISWETCPAALEALQVDRASVRASSLAEQVAYARDLSQLIPSARGVANAELTLVAPPPETDAAKAARTIGVVQGVLGIVGSLTTTAGLILGVVPIPGDAQEQVSTVAGGVAAGGAALNMVGSVAGLIFAGKPPVSGVPLPSKRPDGPVSPADPAARQAAATVLANLQAGQRRLAVFLEIRAQGLATIEQLSTLPPETALTLAPARFSDARALADQLDVELTSLADQLNAASRQRASTLLDGLPALHEQVLDAQASVRAWRERVPPVWARAEVAWAGTSSPYEATCPPPPAKPARR